MATGFPLVSHIKGLVTNLMWKALFVAYIVHALETYLY